MKLFHWSLLFLMIAFFQSFSQVTGFPTFQKELGIGDELKSQFQQQIKPEKEIYPVTTIVIDSFYYVGPNDVFTIFISPTNINPELTKISSDGQLILPRYGFVDVKGKTLLEVKKEVERVIKVFNPNASVSISLYSPRTCFVKIYGNVKKPGVYYLPSSFRVSDAISIANTDYTTEEATISKLESSIFVNDLERKRQSELIDKGIPSDFYFPTRNIFIYNQNYGFKKADLELSKSRNTFEYDPYIREGDEIFVPYIPVNFEYVTISGAVVQPGKYHFKPGDKVSDLFSFAKGFKENVDFTNIIVQNGKETQKVTFDRNLKIENDFALEPFMNVIVGEIKPQVNDKNGVAGIYGCVEKPGIYPIELGKTRVLDLINLAGGLTCEPALSKSFILRSYQKRQFWEEPSLDLFTIFKQSNLTMEDTTRFKMDLFTKGYFVSCDFYDLIVNKNETQNVLLSDGDLIVLPQRTRSVYVWGQVKNPGFVTYEKGKNYEWYIEKAGGYLSTARKSRVRVIRGAQKVWLKPNEVTINDGDEIYVPGPPDYPPGTEYQYYSLIATGIATLISLTYLIINLTSRK
ncbi:MAG: SLBB domain-containing protein [Ignavibacteria bacterium]|nr:SLBB domain-containing protein [Ignavibacteria bacterium]